MTFKSYFSSLLFGKCEWLMNRFVICKTANLTTTEKKQRIDLRNDKFKLSTFFEKTIDEL